MFGEEGTAGAAVVEATILVPILVAMGAYTADFGLFFYTKMQMQNAAQAGAQWAIANRVYNHDSIQFAAQNAVQMSGITVTATPTPFCGCSTDSSGNPTVTSMGGGTCTSAPNSTCNTGGVTGNYLAVTAKPKYPDNTTLYKSFVPFGLISSTYNISATTVVRIQ